MRRASLFVGVVLVLVVATPTRPAAAAARASADGWWDNAAPPLTAPPPDGVAVGATLGNADRMAAVRLDLELPPGTPIEVATLALPQLATSGVAPAVAACPITAAWTPVKAGAWAARP